MNNALDQRDQYGIPVGIIEARRQAATEYAASARQRNRLPCNCPTCRERDAWPAVENILKNWNSNHPMPGTVSGERKS